MFLLDTTILSELRRLSPNQGVVDWYSSVEWIDLHISVMTLGEVSAGIESLSQGPKRRALEAWFEMLPDMFEGRILDVTPQIAVKFGQLQSRHGPLPVTDTLIAATALINRLTVVTRNTADFAKTGVSVHDPWN
jgi:predicted nucleic acid-binding protein